jgi:outer membrane receptor protein involved in Fe transport
MTRNVVSNHVTRHLARKPSRLVRAASCLITGATFLAPAPANADDIAVAAVGSGGAGGGAAQIAALEQENARLRQQLQDAQAQLSKSAPTGEPAPKPVSVNLVNSEAAASASAGTTASDTAAADTAADSNSSIEEVVIGAARTAAVHPPVSHDAPQSVSLLSGDDLQLQDVDDMGGITRRATNVKWNSGNSREFSFSIRGLGYQSNTEAEDPSVGVTVDGVPYAYNPLSSFDYIDLDNVEVLRGPQGTDGGKNANLGVINISTREPSFTPETSYSIAYGQRDSIIASAVEGGPVIDGLLAWRTSLSVDKEGGYVNNIYNTSETYGNRDRVSARTQFLLTPTDDFSALLRVNLQPTGSEFYNGMTIYTPTPLFYANGKPNPLTTDASTRLARSWFTQDTDYSYSADYLYGAGQGAVDNNSQRPLITNSLGGSIELDWKLGSSTLKSIAAYQQYFFFASNDEGTPFDITTASGGGVRYHQVSEELRLDSSVGDLVDYRTGLYLLSSTTQGPVSVSKSGWGSDAGAWFANASQYATLDANGSGQSLLTDSLDGMRKAGYENDLKRSAALYAHATWHLTDPFSVVTGVRATYEYRSTYNNALLIDDGYGAALNPVSVNEVQLGGFGSDGAGNLLSTDSTQQVALANSVAHQYFGAASYSALTAAQKAQIAAAKALRLAQIGVLWNTVDAQPFSKLQPTVAFTPTYKINDDINVYVSYQHGEKAGISQTTNGVSNLTQPEKSNAFELGSKSALLDRTLTLGADVFLNNISNYQQAVQVFDAYTTALNADGTNYFTQATGNAAEVQVKGLELDGAYTAIPYTSIRFSGAYNNAFYKEFKNQGNPVEDANQSSPYRDASGMTLPGAAKFTFDLDVSFRKAVLDGKDFFANFDTSYTSTYNSDVTGLSSYAWIPGHSTTDLSIGVGRSDGKFDLSLLVKNLFNDQSHLATTWDSYTPAPPRWIGIMATGKL